MKPFSFDPEAEEEFLNALTYYSTVNRDLGREFVDEMGIALRFVQEHPASGRQATGRLRVKTLRRFPYSLFYEDAQREIRIHAVMHQARRPRSHARPR